MVVKNVLVTGANRGIGYALCKHYLTKGYNVFAVCRKASQALLDLKGVKIIDRVDVTDEKKLTHLKNVVGNVNLDILINNAGIMSEEVLGKIRAKDLVRQFIVNAVAPLEITQVFRENLKTGSKVILITSRMGSMADNSSGGYYGYRMSKAALNSAGVSLARDLEPHKIAVLMVHPGFVQTELVNNQGDVIAHESAGAVIEAIDKLDMTQSGEFLHANGGHLPW